jgi:hypothetical protein
MVFAVYPLGRGPLIRKLENTLPENKKDEPKLVLTTN